MKKRERGFTLVEILVAIAIMSIMLVMIGGVLQSTTKSNEKERIINEIDAKLSKAVELIKRTAKSAKKTSPTESGMAIRTSEDKKTITRNVPIGEDTITDETVIFQYKQTEKVITAKSGTGTEDVIAENISAAEFEKVEIEKTTIS